MAGSIDPRCETIRGTHWPKPGRVVVWNSRRGNHLGQRAKTNPHQQAGHMDASDPIRPSKNSCATGAVHIWVPRVRGDDDVLENLAAAPRPACGERSECEALRVRGDSPRVALAERAPHHSRCSASAFFY